MNYLLIENKGEIDVNSFILMGGSTKRENEQAIGFFGSGNKYALALAIKENLSIRIFAGNEEVDINTKKVSFRDKEFEQIIINGQDTSLTTTMGPQWKIWQIIREFVSNAIDEGEYTIIDSTSLMEARKGYTRIYIPHTPDILEVINHWDRYFAFDRTDELLCVAGDKIYPQTDKDERLLLYRRNIMCYESPQKSLFHYDLKNFEINESRVIENVYIAKNKVAKFLANHASVEVAFRILSLGHEPEYWEYSCDWYWIGGDLNSNWLTAIGNRVLILKNVSGWFKEEQVAYPHFIVTEEMAKAVRKHFPHVTIYGLTGDDNRGIFKAVSQTAKMTYMLNMAEKFFEETDYNVNFPILVGKFSEESQLGGVGVEEIHLSERVFDMGMKELVMTIMEENEHLKTKYLDCSREFQTHWIRMFVTEKEERFAYFL